MAHENADVLQPIVVNYNDGALIPNDEEVLQLAYQILSQKLKHTKYRLVPNSDVLPLPFGEVIDIEKTTNYDGFSYDQLKELRMIDPADIPARYIEITGVRFKFSNSTIVCNVGPNSLDGPVVLSDIIYQGYPTHLKPLRMNIIDLHFREGSRLYDLLQRASASISVKIRLIGDANFGKSLFVISWDRSETSVRLMTEDGLSLESLNPDIADEIMKELGEIELIGFEFETFVTTENDLSRHRDPHRSLVDKFLKDFHKRFLDV